MIVSILLIAQLWVAANGWQPQHSGFIANSLISGEFWRWISAHITHVDRQHLVLNLLVLVGLWRLFPSLRSHLLALSLVLMLGISALMTILPLHEARFIGFSACLYGLVGYALVRQRLITWLAVICGWTLLESLGLAIWRSSDDVIADHAHWVGLGWGVTLGLLASAHVKLSAESIRSV